MNGGLVAKTMRKEKLTMKKLLVLILLVAVMLCVVACTHSTTLRCDGCGKTVEVELNENETADESWVVFCESCKNNKLAD